MLRETIRERDISNLVVRGGQGQFFAKYLLAKIEVLSYCNVFTKMSETPARLGKSWSEEEVVQLLQNIRKKKAVDEIAKIHERTEGAIRSRLRELAADYHFNDNRSMEEIQKFTGLSVEAINDAIQRRKSRIFMQENRQRTAAEPVRVKQSVNVVSKYDFIDDTHTAGEPTMREMMAVMLDVQRKLTTILEWRG
jgi:hypothetical protein